MQRKLKKTLHLGFPLLLAASLGWAQDGDGFESRLLRGIQAHDQVLAGDTAALARALDLLGPEGWTRPPLALAYHGSALTLQAQEAKAAGKPMRALSLIKDGTKEMDEAVRLEPGDLALRVLRLENSLALLEGSPVDRSREAEEDIAVLAARSGELAPETLAVLELDRGRLALYRRRLDSALGFWRAAARTAPGSAAAVRARTLLSRYED